LKKQHQLFHSQTNSFSLFSSFLSHSSPKHLFLWNFPRTFSWRQNFSSFSLSSNKGVKALLLLPKEKNGKKQKKKKNKTKKNEETTLHGLWEEDEESVQSPAASVCPRL
jgi:hypothetical protein